MYKKGTDITVDTEGKFNMRFKNKKTKKFLADYVKTF